jgi:hypothetical protein
MDTTTRTQWAEEAGSLAELECAVSSLIGNPDRSVVDQALPLVREAIEALRVNAASRAEGK